MNKDGDEITHNEPKINYPRKSFFRIAFQSFFIGFNKSQITTLILSLVLFSINSSFSLLHGKFINLIIDKAEVSVLDNFAIVFILIKFGEFIIIRLNKILSAAPTEESEKIKSLFLEKLVHKDTEFFDFEKPASLIKAYKEEFYHFRSFEIIELINIFLKNLITLIFTLISLVWISKTLFLIEIFKILVKVIFNYYDTQHSDDIYRKIEENYEIYESIMRETMINIKLVKLFSSEDKIMGKLISCVEDYKKIGANNDTSRINDTHNLVVNLIKAGQILYSINMITSGQLTYGEFSSFELIALDLSLSSGSIYYYIISIIENARMVERFLNYMDYDPKIKSGKLKKQIQGHIEFKEVDFCYPTKKDIQIFKNLSFSANPGEIIAFVGPSGCGKSTISTLTHRIYDTSGGEVLIDGIDVKDFDLENLHSQYGYISQDPMLFTGTIKSNLTFGVDEFTQDELDRACKISNCYEFIMNKNYFPSGYDSEIIDRGSNLSGGQKQRIAIARALIKKIKILILDEATSALDANSESQVQKALENISQEGKITTIIIAHRLSTVKNSDRIYVIKNGGIIEKGKHHELLDLNGEYKKLVENQIQHAN